MIDGAPRSATAGTSNALAELRESGIITTGRKTLVIHDPARLRQMTSRV